MPKVKISQKKLEAIQRLSNDNHVIAALAIDQRNSLKKMLSSFELSNVEEIIKSFKKIVSHELTLFSSSILLDPEYGLPASKERQDGTGLLLAYEVTGYDKNKIGRLPRLVDDWSVFRLKEAGADAVKFLLYYDVDEKKAINDYKHVYMERVGTECAALDMPFFLEIITYDTAIEDAKGASYAKIKPAKVIGAMKEFSKEKYQVDVLKMEVPVNMNYVEGYTAVGVDAVYTQEEAAEYFQNQEEATHIPYIYLSAGVSMELFKETLRFAQQAGSKFNGVLCGRATWKDAVAIYAQEGEQAAVDWLRSQGKENIESLNNVVKETATPWSNYYEVSNE